MLYNSGWRVAQLTAPTIIIPGGITETPVTIVPPFPFLHGGFVPKVIEDIESVKGPSAGVPPRNVCVAEEFHDIFGKADSD